MPGRPRRGAATGVRALPFDDAVLDVVEDGEEQRRAGGRDAVQRRRRRRFEQHVEGAAACQEAVEADGEQGALRPGPVRRRPVRAQLDDELVAQRERVRIQRLGDGRQLPARRIAQEQLAAVEIDLAQHELALVAGRRILPGGDGQIVFPRFVDGRGVFQRRPAPPGLDDARVAGFGHRPGAEVRCDEQRVRVDPAGARLRFRQRKTTIDEGERPHVEFAHDVGIAAAARQGDEAARAVRFQERHAGPHPVLVFNAGEGVQVQHRFPGGFRLAVFVQRGAAPDAPFVIGVAPEVVEPAGVMADVGDAVARVEDRLQPRAQGRVARQGGEFAFRFRIAVGHPAERTVGIDVFQPQPGVELPLAISARFGHTSKHPKISARQLAFRPLYG
ncbi:conserved hypothetical protein [Ricinus communis]|uniref:Uncharacterized protein n=1 Tax=Ricinus communis TaxID=3988 RepID=B9TI57_RICCO|nr:conserved hypothetical protein [Ricinus communis]